ncbi:trypsin-like serine protease [Arthrobacter sp. M2012083]|uniref:trypsin-like serine protease n=1 Tax=Arthrobacter sp. M2012083 TaxID=1197706 RepID=UPI00031F12DD|nr:trypsin-like serine protease [Arthrobacter sp. M2012083]
MKRTASVAAAAALSLAVGLMAQAPAQAISNSPATPAGTNDFVVKIDTGFNTCTGTLVAAQWVLTAASCFQQDPAQYASLNSGVPTKKIKVLFGVDTAVRDKTGLGVIHVERRGDRDMAMVKLAKPVTVAPVNLPTTALQNNEQLSFTGFGRTHDTWIPGGKHTGTFVSGALTAETTQISPGAAGVALCAGDSGAPGLRTTANGPELVAVNSRSWQNGCLYAQTATTGPGTGSRVDNITDWIKSLVSLNVANGSVAQIRATGANGNCLYVNNEVVRTETCGTNPNRKWEFKDAGAPNTFTIKNVSTGTCLTGDTNAGTSPQIAVATCSDPVSAHQKWELTQTDGTTTIKNVGNQAVAQFQGTASTANVNQVTGATERVKWTLSTGDYFDLSASDVVAVSPDGSMYNLYQYEATSSPGLLNGVSVGTGWSGLQSGFVTDWNADGFQDLVVQWNDGKLRLYRGSTSVYTGYEVIGEGWSGWQLSIGRWKTADVYPSIIATSTDGIMRNYENPNGGRVGNHTQIGQGWSGLEIVQMDFDKDKSTDIVAKNSAGELKLYRGNGTGGFLNVTPAVVGWGWNVITAMSPTSGFAGPGTTGMLARTSGGELKYYPINANGAWGNPTTVGSGWSPLKIFRSTMP